MSKYSRTEYSFRNMFASMAGYALNVILSFVCRIFFARILGAEYLGISGMFQNVLSLLTLTELGIGTAIILKSHSSTGGSDLVSYIINKQNPTIQTSKILVIIDATIIFLNMIFLKEIEIGLYSAISIFIMGKMLDILFEGIYFTKLAIIISDKSEEIAKRIEKNIKRGSTGLYGKGMYTGEEKLILMCAVSRNNLEKLKLEAKSVDPDSFIIITNSREVVGLGFKEGHS